MATGGSSPGAKTRILRLSLAGIVIALALLVALLAPESGTGPADGAAETIEAPEGEGPAAEEPGAEEPGQMQPAAGEPEPTLPAVGEPKPTVPGVRDPAGGSAPVPAPRLYLVIDDVGNRREDLDLYLDLDIPVTFAVLPQLGFSRESAERIAAAGQEVILHLPMEAESGKYPGPGTIYVGDSPRQISRTIQANLRTVPGARGINNHMGSKATADRETMSHALSIARREGLFFLDSRTTHRTVALEVAREKEVPAAERNVFLDNVREGDAIRAALQEGVAIARERGYAVLIGHATSPELAVVLAQEAPAIREAGLGFFHLSDLMAETHAGTWD